MLKDSTHAQQYLEAASAMQAGPACQRTRDLATRALQVYTPTLTHPLFNFLFSASFFYGGIARAGRVPLLLRVSSGQPSKAWRGEPRGSCLMDAVLLRCSPVRTLPTGHPDGGAGDAHP